MYESFDTETLNRTKGGYAILLLNSLGQFQEFPRSFSDIFGFLNGHRYTCYNMDFDTRAIAHEKFIPWQILERLALYSSADWQGFSFRYIPKKFFQVRYKRDQFELFDISQFFAMSLRSATAKYLGPEFQKDEIPKSWYNELDKCLLDCRHNRVIEYGLQDAKCTKELTQLLLKSFSLARIECSSLISPASLAKTFFKEKLKNSIKIPTKVNRAFANSLYGGRVEVSKLGRIDGVKLYDIHSAYPSVMALLPAVAGLSVVESGCRTDCRNDVVYGSYQVSVEVSHDYYFGPLAVNNGGIVEYPVGRFRTICGVSGIRTLSKYKIPFKITKAIELCGRPRYFPFSDVPKMYLQRKIPILGLSMKLVMNSGFGMLCETQEIHAEDGTSFKSRNVNGNFIRTSSILGNYNCFPMASAITEATRIKIWEVMHKYGSKVHMSATDSVLVDDSVNLPTSDDLGGWGLDGEYAKAVILGCGRYLLYDSAGNLVKKHNRGFDLSDSSFNALKQCKRSSVDLPLFTAGSLRQWALGGCLDDLNVLDYVKRTFRMDDTKRKWNGSFSRICDAWTRRIDSKPWIAI